MKKIMFKDKMCLTQAVLEGRKTQTRRVITYPKAFHGKDVCGYYVCRRATDRAITEVCMYDENIMCAGELQTEPLRKSACMMKTKVSLTKDRYCLTTMLEKWSRWRKAIVPLQKNWKIAKMQLAPHITRRMCKRLLNTYRGWSIPASIIKCSLPQTR